MTLRGGVAHQVGRVLRLRTGDYVTVLDNTGWEYAVKLDRVEPDRVEGSLADKTYSAGEPQTIVTLYQGLLKANKFEWVLQKGTELGISSFVPLSCQRSVPKAEAEWSTGRYPRWRKIISEAAEQSRRGRLPTLEMPVSFHQGADMAQGLRLMPWEEERHTSLKSALQEWKKQGKGEKRISLLIGPEGGFTLEEVEYALSKDVIPISLGSRILRAETAGLVAASATLYELGELGG